MVRESRKDRKRTNRNEVLQKMRMQEVIAKLREEAPRLENCAKRTDVLFNKAYGLFDDFRRAGSDAGRTLLADAVCLALNEFADEYGELRMAVENVCLTNAEYKEKLGPGRRKAKSKDAPGQQMLDLGDAPQAGEAHGDAVADSDTGVTVSTYDAITTAVAEQGDRASVTPSSMQSLRRKEP